MLAAFAVIAAVQSAPALSAHWDVEDRRVVSSVISPCLSYVVSEGNTQPRWAAGWTLDPGQNWHVRPRSDNTEYRASMSISSSFAPTLRCSVTVPSGDLAGALAQLEAITLEDFSTRREGNEVRFYYREGPGVAPQFTMGARTNDNGSVSVWIATPGM
ncbi:hypothetical protein GGQ87_000197 [Brevundimonas alba]|uniref:Uncharacterized protein n=1 Tax=Brevundimonas alba TaxID=74314 RepID=A0A7X5YJR1_9CAUL|nr:hypothetical protein [Brevundimonas alba]NJC39939.1 hypothetical protein [Brevundimonas alba]